MKLEFSWQIFAQYSNIKFRENPYIGSRVVPRGQTEGRTEMTKLTVAFKRKLRKRLKIIAQPQASATLLP